MKKLKNILKELGIEPGRVYTDKDRPPFKVNEGEDRSHIYQSDRQMLEKAFKDVEWQLKNVAKDLGKIKARNESLLWQRFYKKEWIEFQIKFEKLWKSTIEGK
jgi:signal recognition particle subunit SEC65